MDNRLLVLGGGESGIGAAVLAKSKGFDVFLSDANQISAKYKAVLESHQIAFEEASHDLALQFKTSLVVKSPGIPSNVKIIQKFKSEGASVISEIEFASYYTDAFLIAITGSNGKTTTSLLTYHLLKSAGLSVGLAGNVGDSFALQVAENNFEYYVLEISSFQLDDIQKFRPNISVILNITPDHLDRYEYSFPNYINSKFKITTNQSQEDSLIYFADSLILNEEIEKRHLEVGLFPISLIRRFPQGGFMNNDKLISVVGSDSFEQDYNSLPLRGPHNAINALTAIAICQKLKISHANILKGILSFKNAPHRLEVVANIDGVTFINDSKATNVDSVYHALGSFESPIILIAGGVDKGNDYSQIEELVLQKVKGMVVLAKDFEKLVQFFDGKVATICHTQQLEEAILTAQSWANDGDVVLFSPACASFDLFKNYEDRGNQFKEIVMKLNR